MPVEADTSCDRSVAPRAINAERYDVTSGKDLIVEIDGAVRKFLEPSAPTMTHRLRSNPEDPDTRRPAGRRECQVHA